MTDPTEGPWIRHGITAGCHLIRAATGRIIGCIGIQGIDPRTWFVDETDRANATLIAAAPDLLAAAVGAISLITSEDDARITGDGGKRVLRSLEEAVALAEGVLRHACDSDPGLPALPATTPPRSIPPPQCGCGHQRRDHSVGGLACTVATCGCTLFSTAPRRTVEEDLREALDDAAASLETVARWGTKGSPNHGSTASLRSWAKSRARAARSALDPAEDPEPKPADCPECGHQAPGHFGRCLSACPPTVKR